MSVQRQPEFAPMMSLVPKRQPADDFDYYTDDDGNILDDDDDEHFYR